MHTVTSCNDEAKTTAYPVHKIDWKKMLFVTTVENEMFRWNGKACYVAPETFFDIMKC